MQQKNYDLIGDLLETDVLMLFRQVLREEESLLKVGVQEQFGYLPTMTLSNIGVMNTESFCERILSFDTQKISVVQSNRSDDLKNSELELNPA